MAFNDKKKEYEIEDMYPKRPWVNYLWNEKYIAVINQFGGGKGQTELENHFWHNMIKTGDSRLIFIKNDGEIYAANRNYNGLDFEKFSTVVGMGYSKIVSEYKGLECEFTILVPNEGMRECWRVTLKNNTDTDMDFDLYAYADIDAQLTEHLSCNISNYNSELNGILMSHNVYNSPSCYHMVHFATDAEIYSYETAKRRFFGVYGDTRNPQELLQESLSSLGNSFDNETPAVLQIKVSLKTNETRAFYFTAGTEKNYKDVIDNSRRAVTKKYFDEQLKYLKEQASKYDDRVYVKTPDDEVNRFANIWLKRQMELGKTWGRVYNKGFRDIMQDISGFIQLDPEISREKILDCLQYQKKDGNTLRSWVPLDMRNYRDGAVWLISALVTYIKETADKKILEIPVKYWESDIEETVLKHAIRGAEFLFREVGKNGLCLWGGGDWNDSFDGAGIEMKGESVWLSIAAVKAANDLLELLSWLGMEDLWLKFKNLSDNMKSNINRVGFDTDHYIYGINDRDEVAGSYKTKEAQIFLNPQTWAVMAGISDNPNGLLDIVEKELSCDFGYVQQKPCFTVPNPNFGRITYFGKGFYENGSCYNHGCAFKIVADCMADRGEQAYRTLKMILPSNEKNDFSKSGVEPYAVCNMYFGPENETRAGEAPMSWITGTSGWAFRGITEYILGVRAEFDGLLIDPKLPDSWQRAEIVRTFRGTKYEIEIIKAGNRQIFIDGTKYDSNVLPVLSDETVHKIRVEI